jgi:hypothetical protein
VRTERGRCPPAPPASLCGSLDTTEFAPGESEPWVRIYWRGKDPLGFAIAARGNRFDPLASPWAATKVLYAGEKLPTAVAETVLRWHALVEPGEPVSLSESAHLRDRKVARFKSTRPLRLIDASGLAMAKVEEVVSEVARLPQNALWKEPPKPIAEDIFQCDASEYATTQQWCAWFRSQHPTADGLTWISRHLNHGRCVVLFDDRCEKELALVGRPVPLYEHGSQERRTVDQMVGQLGWGIEA